MVVIQELMVTPIQTLIQTLMSPRAKPIHPVLRTNTAAREPMCGWAGVRKRNRATASKRWMRVTNARPAFRQVRQRVVKRDTVMMVSVAPKKTVAKEHAAPVQVRKELARYSTTFTDQKLRPSPVVFAWDVTGQIRNARK